jgi:hypothetical protein
MRHGPHQGAQKSTRTGISLSNTRDFHVASVTTPATATTKRRRRRKTKKNRELSIPIPDQRIPDSAQALRTGKSTRATPYFKIGKKE